MKAVEFCYWLQGFFEIGSAKTLSPDQLETIKNHLALVFKHDIDPSYSNDPKVQAEMQKIHDGQSFVGGNDLGGGSGGSGTTLYRC